MKKHLIALAASVIITTGSVFAHGEVELGPNGGRLLEFSKDETMHGEVTVKDGKFNIALLDKDKKPVAIKDQTITANGGPSSKAVKLEVGKEGDHFVIPGVKSGEWLILQYKNDPKAKAVTARLEYNTKECSDCKAQEWICKCAEEKAAKGKK